jgi:hypothetical protein
VSLPSLQPAYLLDSPEFNEFNFSRDIIILMYLKIKEPNILSREKMINFYDKFFYDQLIQRINIERIKSRKT